MTDPEFTIEEVRTTLPTQTAANELAKSLVENKLAACVQITGPIQSVYRWKGELSVDQEFSLSCKTNSNRLNDLLEHLREQHPYELPEILIAAWRASPEYANWVNSQVG